MFENLNNDHASFSDLVFVRLYARYAKYDDKPNPEIKKINPAFP